MLQTKLKTNTKWDNILTTVDQFRYVIPKTYKSGMLVDALIFSSPELLEHVCHDLSLEQAANVAMLPGILKQSLVMPDVHQGYGFPIGGVAAMDIDTGVVSPGGVGFDINCGVRLLTSELQIQDVRPQLLQLVDGLFAAIPAGTGSEGRIKLSYTELNQVLELGSQWAVAQKYASPEDLDHTEEGGCMQHANPAFVSDKAKKRGSGQLGTLGSGNHFLEIQFVEQIFDCPTAQAFGLFEGQVCLMIHCGSRGLGHQVCTDYVASMKPIMDKYQIIVPDRELACCPIRSSEGQQYLSAMAASANFAFANRQIISYWAKQVLTDIFGHTAKLKLLYDVAHNMAKFEKHLLGTEEKTVLVHRKGATRAFPAGRSELVGVFQLCGQPVIIPGDMGRGSYVLVGTDQALTETFGSVCHGAGRLMSRTQARKGRQAKDIVQELLSKGIVAKATTREGLTEEVPEAYKPIDAVIDAVHSAGLARRVARLRPVGVIKG
ncbi:MAG: RtcB family protein [Candidatus Melainabacteria bacterium]|nr:RtcB family protein [Candidatus Melainabacteria bacterium]